MNSWEWGSRGCIRNCTPHIPGEWPGVGAGQGGNCLGRVRTCGQFPERARVSISFVAERREVSCCGVKSEGMRTKPSRVKASRSGDNVERVVVVVVVVVAMIEVEDTLLDVI